MRKEQLKVAKNREIDRLETQIAKLEQQSQHNRNLYEDRARVADVRNKAIKRERAKVRNLEDQIAFLKNQIHYLEETNEMLSDQASDMQEVEIHDEHDAYALGVENAELRAKVDDLTAGHDALQQYSDGLEMKLHAANNHIDHLQKKADDLETRVKDMKAWNESLENGEYEKALKASIKDLQDHVQELRNEATKKEQRIIKLQDENAQFLNDFTLSGMNLQLDNIDYKEENENLKQEIEKLQKWKETANQDAEKLGQVVDKRYEEYKEDTIKFQGRLKNYERMIVDISELPWTKRLTPGSFVSAIIKIKRSYNSDN